MERVDCGCEDRYNKIRPMVILIGVFVGFIIPILIAGIVVKLLSEMIEVYFFIWWGFGIALTLLIILLLIMSLSRFVEWVIDCKCEEGVN